MQKITFEELFGKTDISALLAPTPTKKSASGSKSPKRNVDAKVEASTNTPSLPEPPPSPWRTVGVALVITTRTCAVCGQVHEAEAGLFLMEEEKGKRYPTRRREAIISPEARREALERFPTVAVEEIPIPTPMVGCSHCTPL